MKWQCEKYAHGRSSNTGMDSMVIDRAIYLGKNDALDDFWFVMVICTGQYLCLLLSASLYVLLNRFNVDTGALFWPKAGHKFLIVATLHCFWLENGTVSTGFTTVKIHGGKLQHYLLIAFLLLVPFPPNS